MLRNKAYSLINILGLSVGVACCLLLALYIKDEMSFDQHHADVDNLYRITTLINKHEGNTPMGRTSAPIAWALKDEIPEIESVTRVVNPPGVALNLIKYETLNLYEPDGYIADSSVFDIFTYEFTEGNPKKSLVEANSVVINDQLARKLFGDAPALNKVININQGGSVADFRVTGVYKLKNNSHLKANFFVSMTSSSGWCDLLRSPNVMNEWAGQNFLISYAKLETGHQAGDVIAKMNTVLMKHGAEDLKATGFTKELGLEPVKDIYLYSSDSGPFSKSSARITYLYVIGSIAIFILLIACINFMNLSTAKATKRANEVGLRKTLGAYRSSLIGQFLAEAMVIVAIAIFISIGIIQVALPIFNSITGKEIGFHSASVPFVAGSLLIITLVTGFVAGSYPAFYLSSFQPAKVLKGKSFLQSSNTFLRQSLVVVQFVIAITLVCGMLIIGKQLKFIQEKNLGFDTSQRIVLPLRTGTAQQNYTTLKQELEKNAAVKEVTGTTYIPGTQIWTDFHLYTEGGSVDNGIHVRNNAVEPNYLQTLNIPLISGRNFTENRAAEDGKAIVNRALVKKFGFTPESIIGKPLFFEWQGEKNEFEVIGVMEDFHQVSLKEEIFPLLFRVSAQPNTDYAVLNLESNDFQNALAAISKTWNTVNADTPFEYTFLDESIQKQYEEDKRVSKIITSFTVIAMIISCLGLYGLSTYMAERRFKEIGVRKVLGASINQIVAMMSGEFMKLVFIAFLIAVPISLYGINLWLEGFAYRTDPSAMVFILAGVAALLIALMTVSFESIRAASGNPVNALRNE